MRELAVMEWLTETVVACPPGILFARTWACSTLGWHPPSEAQWHLITWHFQSPPTFIHNYFSVTGLNSTFQVKGIWRTLAKDPAPTWSKGGHVSGKKTLGIATPQLNQLSHQSCSWQFTDGKLAWDGLGQDLSTSYSFFRVGIGIREQEQNKHGTC